MQRQEAKSGECDVFSSDVIWTAEFANQKWLYDMTPYVETRKDEFIPATLETDHLRGQELGRARHVRRRVHLLPHRQGQGGARRRGRRVYEDAAKKGGIVYQGAAYEGLTCDFLEIAFAAGGKVLSDDGKKAEFDSPENLKALQLHDRRHQRRRRAEGRHHLHGGASRDRAFENGKPAYMRNWPYAYAAGKKNKNAPDFEVAPFPPFEGGGKAGILGGHNKVISVYSENPGGALAFVDYATSLPRQIEIGAEYSLPPALSAAYDDPKLKKALPFSDRAQAGDRAGQAAPGLAGVPADLARRSTRTSTRRSRARSPRRRP